MSSENAPRGRARTLLALDIDGVILHPQRRHGWSAIHFTKEKD